MSSSILHHCSFCGQTTDVSTALATFVENPHCSQCGLSSHEGNMKVQDDLAALFARQMNMGGMEYQEAPSSTPSSSQASPITYSITQHYHHSSHVARPVSTEQSSTCGSFVINTSASSVDEALRSHGIDPTSLSPGQIDLFAHAIPEQKSRLIQMWQICPENSKPGNQSHFAGDLEMGDHDERQYAEPYMVSGYELLAQREYEKSAEKSASLPNEPTTGAPYKVANDPIYDGQRWWEQTEQPMEHQYGSFEQMNVYPGCGIVQPPWLKQN